MKNVFLDIENLVAVKYATEEKIASEKPKAAGIGARFEKVCVIKNTPEFVRTLEYIKLHNNDYTTARIDFQRNGQAVDSSSYCVLKKPHTENVTKSMEGILTHNLEMQLWLFSNGNNPADVYCYFCPSNNFIIFPTELSKTEAVQLIME